MLSYHKKSTLIGRFGRKDATYAVTLIVFTDACVSKCMNLLFLLTIFSQRQIERRLKALKLTRRGPESPMDEIITAIRTEIETGGRSLGIHMLWRRLRNKYGLSIRRQTVRDVLDALLPGELQKRKRNRLSRRTYSAAGPNHVIHVDQYDKLGQFGFFIHGAMDGFSRLIVWLHIGHTNRESACVLRFYMNYVRTITGVPRILRTDAGTENSLMTDVHNFLHSDILNSNHRSYIIGRSVHNQRIERFWCFLRSHFSQYWMDLFHDMMLEDLYDPNEPVERELLQFCFGQILMKELHLIEEAWNFHKVRRSTISDTAVGIPHVLYNVPELFGKSNCKKDLDVTIIDMIDEMYGKPLLEYVCSDDFAELCLDIMEKSGWQFPNSAEEALDVYGNLLAVFSAYL